MLYDEDELMVGGIVSSESAWNLLLAQPLQLLAQVSRLVVLGDGVVEGDPGLHDVDHGASSTRT